MAETESSYPPIAAMISDVCSPGPRCYDGLMPRKIRPAAGSVAAGSHNRVGVRELRRSLSRYLQRVRAGERFEITARNLPVAILQPLPERSSALERLTAAGRVVPARLDLLDLGPPPDRPHALAISEALAEQRQERQK